MSVMMETAQNDQNGQSSVAQFSQSAPQQRIKRIGARPLVFEGSELAMAMSYTPKLPFWYELNLYRTSAGKAVAAVRLFHQSEDEEDTVRAWECGSLDEAVEKLAHYDAADDVQLTMDASMSQGPAAELAAQAMALRAEVKTYRSHYASLIGEFLYDLENE